MALPLSSPFAYLGALTASYLLYNAGRFVHLYFLHRSTLPRYLHASRPGSDSSKSTEASPYESTESQAQSKKSWALITGASDGIGLGMDTRLIPPSPQTNSSPGFAQELASRSFNIILHGRNPTKLSRTQQSLHATFPSIQTRLLILDASTFTPATIRNALDPLLSLPITVLINNVGGTAGIMQSSDFEPLMSQTPDEIAAQLAVNATFPTHLTRALLPTLAANTPSLIINISSIVSMGFPYLSTYSASKAFNIALSTSLTAELGAEGYDVESLAIIVCGVQSAGNAGAKLGWFIPDSRSMAGYALGKVGCGRAAVAGYWAHAVQVAFVKALPESWVRAMLVGQLKPRLGKRATESFSR
jgi:17beta-estradiol 17-dehydrogenase / very-long-chain 3-oxoacyl-CoA reductase